MPKDKSKRKTSHFWKIGKLLYDFNKSIENEFEKNYIKIQISDYNFNVFESNIELDDIKLPDCINTILLFIKQKYIFKITISTLVVSHDVKLFIIYVLIIVIGYI